MSAEPQVPESRCGFTYDVSTLPDIGACTCWRPVWQDEERCIWHSERAEKPPGTLADAKVDCPERLDGLVLDKVSLDGVDWFEGCTLLGASISAVDLRGAALSDTDFREASLQNVDARGSDLRGADLEDASVSASDFRDVSLENVRLDQAVFSNVRISRGTSFGEEAIYEQRLDEEDDDKTFDQDAQAAIWAYREIQTLLENNALPLESRRYFLREKDMRRRIAWHHGRYVRALKAEGYRWVTGYGRSPWRVIAAMAILVVVSALLYPLFGGLQETIAQGSGTQTVTWHLENPDAASIQDIVFVYFRSLYFSVVTFTTLGYGDISPVGGVARVIASIESLLGTLLSALLVFVLSQRIS